MIYLLDTDTLVYYLRERIEVKQKLLSIPLRNLCTSTVCIGELYYGAAKSQKQIERKAEVDQLRAMLISLALSDVEMEGFGNLKASLEARGERLSDADLMIAATALEHNLIVVTGNLNHFKRVNGLRVESWLNR